EDLDEGVPMGLTTFAVVFGDSHGGVAIEGVRGDQTFSVLGPSDSIWLESPPPSTGPTPGVLVLQPRYEEIELDDVLGHWLESGRPRPQSARAPRRHDRSSGRLGPAAHRARDGSARGCTSSGATRAASPSD